MPDRNERLRQDAACRELGDLISHSLPEKNTLSTLSPTSSQFSPMAVPSSPVTMAFSSKASEEEQEAKV